MTNETKLIRVLDRKVIPTSRGTCRGPIGPYRETLNRILVLLSRGFNVVEVIDDKEVKLTEANFDKDNSKSTEDGIVNETPIEVDEKKDETPVVPEEKVENNKDKTSQPPETNRQLSKKERKQKAREQREQQNRENANNNAETPVEEKAENTEVDVVPESAIEE